MELERRFTTDTLEVRKDTEGKEIGGGGYAAKFNVLSEDLGGFVERIAPGFFDEVLDNDVRVLINHDPNMILGRTKSNTASVSVDKTGLRYDWDDPGTTYSKDLQISMKRGDVDQSSFQFRVKEDTWEEMDINGEPTIVRTLLKASELRDASPVTFPAYPDATVQANSIDTEYVKRCIQEIKGKAKPSNALAEHEYRKRKQLQLKLKENGQD